MSAQRPILLIGTFVVILTTVGFTQLPLREQGRIVEVCTFGNWPLEWAVRRQFARKQPELRSIIDFVKEAPEVAGLTVTPAGLRASLHQSESEQYDLDQPNILQDLVSIEAQFVNVHDDRVSVFLGSEVRGSSSFEVSYIYPTSRLNIADCDSIAALDTAEIGSCVIQLSPKWHALYQWYPEDLDKREKAIEGLK